MPNPKHPAMKAVSKALATNDRDRPFATFDQIAQLAIETFLAHEAAPKPSKTAYDVGKWLCAALDDPDTCEEMKADIRAWFEAGQPQPDIRDPAAAFTAGFEAGARRIMHVRDPKDCGFAPDIKDARGAFLEGLSPSAGDAAEAASLREELACTLEELIDHNGDSMDDARAKRVAELRGETANG